MGNKRQGIFIVIEGTDGSGKGTQFKLLRERLEREGYDVEAFDFPQYDQPSSYFVTRYLNGAYGGADDVGPYTSSLFYALDRFEAAPNIQAALDAGKVVISNRFTGSSMGHQGTKFDNPEERRGFFIWLDNLEFEMLRIPRPDMSFVLRVPAATAQQLVDQKEQRNYTDKKRDIHEADLSHLERAVSVYDDLCQLFPKDFTRIDCVRGDQLLDVPTIQELIWQKINPLLPTPGKTLPPLSAETVTPVGTEPQVPPQQEADQQDTKETTAAAPTPANNGVVILEPASHLVLASLAAHRGVLGLKRVSYDERNSDGKYQYCTPDYLPDNVQAKYQTELDAIFTSYSQMLAALTAYLQEAYSAEAAEDLRRQAQAILKVVLPVASTVTIAVDSTKADADIATELLSNALPEARQVGQQLASKTSVANPAALVTYRAERHQAVAEVARQYLQETYGVTENPVRLAAVWPRNELDLVADILYPESSTPLEELRASVQHWPYNRKLAVLEAYLNERQNAQQIPDDIMASARYSWDLLSTFDTMQTLLQTGLLQGARWQALSPRHGFHVPPLVEQAGLSDQFEACFDRSMALYSALQQAGFPLEAQYATLLGHQQRWRVTYDGTLAFQLHEYYADPGTHQGAHELLHAMHQRLAEAHPLIADAMKFATHP